jgi:hypothetical protein
MYKLLFGQKHDRLIIKFISNKKINKAILDAIPITVEIMSSITLQLMWQASHLLLSLANKAVSRWDLVWPRSSLLEVFVFVNMARKFYQLK